MTHDIHKIFIPYLHDIHTRSAIFIESVYSKIKDSITVNIDTNHFKNSLKYLLVCSWRYLSLESFTLSKLSDVDLTYLPEVRTPMSKVICEKTCERGCSGRCLFYFQCSTVNIYKYKGRYMLRRIPHASHRSFNSFVISNIINKNTSMRIYQLRYVALRFPLTKVSLQGQSILLWLCFRSSHTKELLII